jgi:hypothetical protein
MSLLLVNQLALFPGGPPLSQFEVPIGRYRGESAAFLFSLDPHCFHRFGHTAAQQRMSTIVDWDHRLHRCLHRCLDRCFDKCFHWSPPVSRRVCRQVSPLASRRVHQLEYQLVRRLEYQQVFTDATTGVSSGISGVLTDVSTGILVCRLGKTPLVAN